MTVAGFITSQRTEHGVPHAVSCRALDVSESWFYKWRDREPTERQRRRVELTEAIKKVFHDSGGTYGSPRIGDELRENGRRVSDNTVAGIMAENGWVARKVKRRRGLTRQGRRRAAPDLVRRAFTAVAADVLWVGDVTEIPSDEGRLYLATVEERFSGRLLGYATSAYHDTELTCAALRMAVATRGGAAAVDGVIFHSDRGGERRTQLVVATPGYWVESNSASRASAGVFHPSVLRGLPLSVMETASMSAALHLDRSVPFGKYCRSSPLVFSFVPRCQGLCGSAK